MITEADILIYGAWTFQPIYHDVMYFGWVHTYKCSINFGSSYWKRWAICLFQTCGRRFFIFVNIYIYIYNLNKCYVTINVIYTLNNNHTNYMGPLFIYAHELIEWRQLPKCFKSINSSINYISIIFLLYQVVVW